MYLNPSPAEVCPVSDIEWSELHDAYGPATRVPQLLERARVDLRSGHHSRSAWFDLWSGLCHQGDIYTASYAALPALVDIAADRAGSPHQFDPLFLVACIELARLEGRGPTPPVGMERPYSDAVQRAVGIMVEAIADPLYQDFPDYLEALKAGLLALQGDGLRARQLLDSE